MKWNVGLVLFLASLLAIRFIIIDDRFSTDVNKPKIRINPIVIDNRTLKEVFQETALLKQVGKREELTKSKNKQEGTNNNALVHASLHCEKPFVKEQNEFFPSDKIYIALFFPKLKAGKHNLSTHWKTPWGTIARTVVRNIELNRDVQSYNAHFWFQLVENGMFTQMFSGSEYNRKVYGEWEVLFYLNKEPVVTKQFVVAAM